VRIDPLEDQAITLQGRRSGVAPCSWMRAAKASWIQRYGLISGSMGSAVRDSMLIRRPGQRIQSGFRDGSKVQGVYAGGTCAAQLRKPTDRGSHNAIRGNAGISSNPISRGTTNAMMPR
jgi:hypothetical protein